jgi:hypothetical protein
MPEAWACGNGLFYHRDFSTEFEAGVNFPNVTGQCTTGTDYRWGFSFLMLLLVCILNMVAAIGFLSLWLYGNRDSNSYYRGRDREGLNTIQTAADIVAQAKEYYGEAAVDGTWSSQEMNKKIYKGKRGMRMEVPG